MNEYNESIELLREAGAREAELCREVERLKHLAAAESKAKENAWQRINELEKKLNILMALFDSAKKELSEVDELLSQSQRVNSRYFDEIVSQAETLRSSLDIKP